MSVPSCPYPGNINPLYLTGYQFVIQKLPEITYFIQETQVPSITLGESRFGTGVHDIKMPGDTLEFGELQIQFIIDENLSNWNAIYFWMSGLGFPEGHHMYTRYINASINKNLYSENSKGVSDGTLTLLDSSNNIKQAFTFVDLFPTNLSGLNFTASLTDPQPAVGTASFAYSYYSIDKIPE